LEVQVLVVGGNAGVADQHVRIVRLDCYLDNRFPDIFSGQKTGPGRGFSGPLRTMSGKRSFAGHG
jgi:hypothetical protein